MRFILTWYFFTISLHGLVFVFTRHLVDFFFPPFPFVSVYLCLCYTAPCRRWLCMMLIADCRWYPFSFDEPTVLYCSVFFARDAMCCLILHHKMLLGPAGVVSFFSRVLAPVSSASPYAHVGAHTLPFFFLFPIHCASKYFDSSLAIFLWFCFPRLPTMVKMSS